MHVTSGRIAERRIQSVRNVFLRNTAANQIWIKKP